MLFINVMTSLIKMCLQKMFGGRGGGGGGIKLKSKELVLNSRNPAAMYITYSNI